MHKKLIRGVIRNFLTIMGIVWVMFPILVKAQSKEIPFTLDDRDRIIRTEQKIEHLRAEVNGLNEKIDSKIDSKVDGLRAEMNARFEAVDQRFDQLFNFLWAIIGIFTTMVVSIFGFAFWDRKLSLAPLKKEEEKLRTALIEYAKIQPKFAEILKNAGLL